MHTMNAATTELRFPTQTGFRSGSLDATDEVPVWLRDAGVSERGISQVAGDGSVTDPSDSSRILQLVLHATLSGRDR